eukprot:9078559-Ditylum_brightwellii.AAC.1
MPAAWGGAQEVGDCVLGPEGSYDTSHVGERENFSSTVEYDSSDDPRTVSEADDHPIIHLFVPQKMRKKPM